MTRQNAAVVVLLDPHRRVLLLRRGPTDRWKPGHWNLPGGRVDKGETPIQGAMRELWEEAGIILRGQVGAVHSVFTVRPLPYRTLHVFTASTWTLPHVSSNDGEHDAYMWAPLDEPLPKPHVPGLRGLVGRACGTRVR